MRNIYQEICDNLTAIEQSEGVKILLAVESGSRAWGVESPDSDYDVRFIYVRKKEDYLRLDRPRDVIEWQLDEVLDINGWDLTKTLTQVHKGNAGVFEWANSPVIYKMSESWPEIYEVSKPYFSTKASWMHYVGLAKGTWMKYLQDENVPYKKYIYALRPLLACRYIETYRSAPPVQLADLLRQELPEDLKAATIKMLEIKEQGNEKTRNPRVPILDEFIVSEIHRFEMLAGEMEDDRTKDWEPLNEIFRRIISE